MTEVFNVDVNKFGEFGEETWQKVNKNTKFVLMTDGVNSLLTDPLGPEYLKGRPHIVENLVKEYRDCIFITDRYLWNLEKYDNVIYLPMYFIESTLDPFIQGIEVDWQAKRPKTANYQGGYATRITRLLTNFWLAKNYPIDQLVYTANQNDTSLDQIKWIIQQSPKSHHKHMRHKTFLPVRWYDNQGYQQGIPGKKNWGHFGEHTAFLCQKTNLPSYLSLACGSVGWFKNTSLDDKNIMAMIGGNLILPLGNYQENILFEKLGLQNPNVFDLHHLSSDDLYWRTIGGLENNAKLITDHDFIENSWFENRHVLKHNRDLSKNSDYWLNLFQKEFEIFKQSLKLSINKKFEHRSYSHLFARLSLLD